MTRDRDIEQILEHWLTDGSSEMPDRVYQAIFDRVERQPQAARTRLLRRLPQMNLPLRILATAAAVVLIAVIGYNLLPGSAPGVGGPAPSATPSPSPSPSTTPGPSVPVMPQGVLPGGTYRTDPLPSVPGLTVTVTVPAGWHGYEGWAILGPNNTDAPNGIGVGFLKVDGIFSDPCHWDADGSALTTQPGDVVVGPTVDDLVAALRANRSYTTTAPAPVTLSGFAGQRIDIAVPPDLDPTTCDPPAGDATGRYFVFTSAGGEGSLYAQGPRQIFHEWILDVDGQRVLIGYNDYATTPAADRAAAEAMIGSMVIQP